MTTILKKIVTDPARLTTPLEPFDFSSALPGEADKIEQEMMEILTANPSGLGLAHNQIGGNSRIIAIKNMGAMFNPKIVNFSVAQIVLPEGCLSFPLLLVKIKRPANIRVRFQTSDGIVRTEQFKGLTARIIQHEIDHLNGVLYYNRASLFHRDQAFRQWNKTLKKLEKIA